MSRSKFLSLLLTSLLLLVAILPGCVPHRTILKAALITAVVVPDFEANASEFQTRPSALPFDIWLVCEPLDSVPEEWGDRDIPEPVLADFRILTDGITYSDEELGEKLGADIEFYRTWFDSTPSFTTVVEAEQAPISEQDTTFAYCVWTKTLPLEDENIEEIWRTHFTLDNVGSKAILDALASGAGEAGLPPEIDWVSNQSLLVWEFDPDDVPEYVYVPIVPVVTVDCWTDPIDLSDEPVFADSTVAGIQPGLYCQWRNESPVGNVMFSKAAGPTSLTEEERTLFAKNTPDRLWQPLDASLDEKPDLIPDTFTLVGFDFSASREYPKWFLEEPTPTPSESESAPRPPFVLGIPVDTESLFDPKEPHKLDLGLRFALDFSPKTEPQDEAPPVEPPPGGISGRFVPQLEVTITPPEGGSVTLLRRHENGLFPVTPDSMPQTDPLDRSGWERRQIYRWTLDNEACINLTATECYFSEHPFIGVILTPVPSEGYRFVGWAFGSTEGVGELKTSPTLELSVLSNYYILEDVVTRHVHAYFERIVEEPEDLDVDDDTTEDAPISVPIAVGIRPRSETIDDESGCRTLVNIDYDVNDLTTVGTRPISEVSLNVDGVELYPWAGVPTSHYENSDSIEWGCNEVHTIGVTAGNTEGQTITTATEVRIPPLETDFTHNIVEVPEEWCHMLLTIDFRAVDKTLADTPITNVVVKANGKEWYNSGDISTDYLDKPPITKEVTCGQTYIVDVIATDADGNKYTYSRTVKIPIEIPPQPPPEEPVPPVPQNTLYVAFAAQANCSSSGEECSCNLSISFDGKDLTVGDYPVKRVVLKVNGSVWHDSGTIIPGSADSKVYHRTAQKTVSCGVTYNIEITATNSIGQTLTSTGSITTPVP